MAEHTLMKDGELPAGTHRVFRVGGREIGVFNVAGRYYALPNHCPHQNGPLCSGSVSGTLEASAQSGWKPTWTREGEVVICPWHTMEFDIISGRCLADPRRRIPTFEVKVVGSEIKVKLP